MARDALLPELAALVQVVNANADDEREAALAAGPLLARLKAANRAANEATRAAKQRTHDARLAMDHTHLGLQNLLYEKRYLESEIDKCRQFAYVPVVRARHTDVSAGQPSSIYEDIPLHDLDDFLQLAPPEASTPEVMQDEHQLMLNRLSFELAERQRSVASPYIASPFAT